MNLRFNHRTIGQGRVLGNRLGVFACAAAALAACSGCKQPEPAAGRRTATSSSGSYTHSWQAEERLGLASAPMPPGGLLQGENVHWLSVEQVKPGTSGGWATGSYDSNRNKIDVTTNDVNEFSINMAELPVDWNRVVIIGIDGINTELRKRNASMYYFARDSSGQWVVKTR